MNYVTPILVAVIFALMPIELVLAKDIDCVKKRGEAQIQACTRIIKSKRLFGKRITKKNLAITYNNRGNAYSNNGSYDRAIEDYNKAIQLQPDDAVIFKNRGQTYGKEGQYEKAISDFNKALQLKPEYAEAYRDRGLAYAKKGQIVKAIADNVKAEKLNPSIELNPKDSMAYHNRGYDSNNRLAKTKLNKFTGVQKCDLTGHFHKDYPNQFYRKKWPPGYLKFLFDALAEYSIEALRMSRLPEQSWVQRLAIYYDVHWALKRNHNVTTLGLVMMLAIAGCNKEVTQAFSKIRHTASNWSGFGLAAHLQGNWTVSRNAFAKAKRLDDKFFDSRPLSKQVFEASKLSKTAFPN